MKYTTLVLALLALPLVAGVQIEHVYYDPLTEAGSEYVLLKNTQPDEINVTGWTLATPTSDADATLAGTIPAGETLLVADNGWDTSKDDASWPAAEHEETLTLPNTGGYVQLVDANGAVRSTVGYEDTNTSEGTPHPGAAEGEALVRTANTGDNSADFTAQTPTFETATDTSNTSGENTTVSVNVTNTAPRLLAWSVEDDDPDTSGVQLLPIPGEERRIAVNVTVADDNTLEGATVRANTAETTLSTNETNTTVSLSVPITTETAEIAIEVDDGELTDTQTVPVELLAVTGIAIPDAVSLDIRPGSQSNTTLAVENTGTTNISLQLKGTAPTLAQRILGDVTYALLGEEYALTDAFRQHDIGLGPGSTASVDLTIEAGYVPAGTYTGQVVIAGVQA